MCKPCRRYLKTDNPFSKTTSIYKHSGFPFCLITKLSRDENLHGTHGQMQAHQNKKTTDRKKKMIAHEKWKSNKLFCFFNNEREFRISLECHKNQWYLPKCAIKIWSAFNHRIVVYNTMNNLMGVSLKKIKTAFNHNNNKFMISLKSVFRKWKKIKQSK